MMPRPVFAAPLAMLAILALQPAPGARAQSFHLDRLSVAELEVRAPSARVSGAPGGMRITDNDCAGRASADRRRRIVNVAVQEWAFFGFNVVDETAPFDPGSVQGFSFRRRRGSWVDPVESARLAASIAGYWSVTSDGAWILSRQNDVWQGPGGVASRWRDPWSAAFISWVMCESGLGSSEQFRRAIAHHSYIDQAIVSRDTPDSPAAFHAFDIGEQIVEPGDLLCSARRPGYRNIAERRAQIGVGARTHCDIVVHVDPANSRVLAIGGNVRGSVRLKLLSAEFAAGADGPGRIRYVGEGSRGAFAHLKLRAGEMAWDAFQTSPTMRALGEHDDIMTLVLERLGGSLSNSMAEIIRPTALVVD